jgi:HAD superfamily hydrolase (TIGR01549 family)
LDSRTAILETYISAIKLVLGYELQPDQDHIRDLLQRRPIEYFRQHYPPFAENLAVHYAQNYRSDRVIIFRGIAELLDEISKRELIGIVSNKGRVRIESDLRYVGIDPKIFSVVIGAEDTVDRKPHPAPILKALMVNGVSASASVYVGDGPHDMVAAKAAGVMAIGVTWGYYPADSLIPAGADQTVNSVGSLANLLLSR